MSPSRHRGNGKACAYMAIKSSPPIVEHPQRRYEPANVRRPTFRIGIEAPRWISDTSGPGWRVFDFPVGAPSGGSKRESADVIPILARSAPVATQAPPPPTRDRPIYTPDRRDLPDESGQAKMRAENWFDYWKEVVFNPLLLPPDNSASGKSDNTITDDPVTVVYGPTKVEDPDMSWIEDAYDWVDENYAGGWLPGGVPVGGTIGPVAPPGFVTPGNGVVGGGGGGGVIVPPQGPSGPAGPAACGPGGGGTPVYKRVCGAYKWVYPKRRRRKSLATKGDLRDLASLKGILGTGKAFEVWIATHS